MRVFPLKHLENDAGRPGTVLVMFTICLIAIMGLLALVIDGGLLQAERIRVQAAADAAALAGASQLYQNYRTNNGKDTGGGAKTGALAIAADNGYANDGTNSTVVVNIPPASGTYAGVAGYVEVIITSNQNRCFSNIWSSATVAVCSRSVARGAWVPFNASILLLDTGDKGAVSVQGNGAFTSSGASAYINSNSSTALSVSGGGSFQVSAVNITGGYSGSGITGTITTGVHPTPDPLAYLPVPGATGAPAIPSAQSVTSTSLGGGVTQYDLYPGSYAALQSFGSKSNVILHQASSNSNGGIYYLSSGGFNTGGNATLSMATGETGGVMIYNAGTGSGDTLNIAGNGGVTLAGLTAGPYTGLLMFQSRASTGAVSIAGNGTFSLAGTLYAPNAQIAVTGNGSASDVASQWICRELYLAGNGGVNIKYSNTAVARTRIIAVVE
jgi:Flp pilus assembly protein TadG